MTMDTNQVPSLRKRDASSSSLSHLDGQIRIVLEASLKLVLQKACADYISQAVLRSLATRIPNRTIVYSVWVFGISKHR